MSNLYFSYLFPCYVIMYATYISYVVTVNLCDPFSLVFTTNYTPPETFTNDVSFNFSFTMLRLNGFHISRWDHSQVSNYSVESELFREFQKILRGMHKHINTAKYFVVKFDCIIEGDGDCEFFLDDDSEQLMRGNRVETSAAQMTDTVFTVQLRNSIFDLLARSTSQLLTQWGPTCARLVLLDQKQVSEYKFYYFPDNSSVVCIFITATPMRYSMMLMGDGLSPILTSPDLSNEEFMILVAQNTTPQGISASQIWCVITSPSGWSIRLSNPVMYDKQMLSTPTVERYPTSTPITEVKQTDRGSSTALDGTPEFRRAVTDAGIVSVVIIMLALAVLICIFVFRHRLGLHCIDVYTDILRENITNKIRYTPSRSRNIS
uniref:Membrane protein a153 n=1 Tax=Mastomys natalensis cytomegalovirus 1 TaxID=2973541 RepID=A0A9Y1N8I4_9BETA|nr:membrane protein a153 [Mastomys natalensis cytomegalovirus 1]WEG71230.1 membrane protein a153 [Mastomys natalensis cytomegalovirus 1]